ncbi:MAG: phage major capsid protein, partial [Clostridiales bacterium]|nr:phage major capsid protein [Clostridiales bacterium]
MNKIVELREKRAKAWEDTKAFLESKRDESGIVSAEDTAIYEKMEADVITLGKEIERLEAQAALDQAMAAPIVKPVVNQPGAFPNRSATGRSGEEYSVAFWNAMRGREFVQNALSIGTDEQGGYLVPDEFARTLVQALQDHNIIRGLARIIPTSSGEMQIPVVAGEGTASWVAEAGEIPDSDSTFDQVLLGAYKIGTMIRISRELLADSAFPMESFIGEEFGRRIGTLEEDAFINGDGVHKPTGVLTEAQIGTTVSSVTAITFDDVMDLFHSLRTPYRNRAVFITNDLTIKVLRKLKSNDGQYLWQPSVAMGLPDTILGRPVHVSGYVPVIEAEAKVMAFGDFSFYWIGDRQGKTFQRLNELYSRTDQVGFKATQRVDGKLILP